MKRLLIPLLVLVAVAAGSIIYFVARRNVTDKTVIRVSGNIETTQVEVSFKLSGRVLERLVDEGDRVKVGQLVARLDSADLQQEVELRRADLAAAQASLAELEAGSRVEEIGQGEATLAKAQAEFGRLKIDYARQQELYRKEVISTRELDATRSAFESAEAQLRLAKEQLTLLQKGPRREKIDQARAMHKQAKAALALAETRLGYATLAAPLNGVVLAKNIEPGEQVAAGTPVVSVAEIESVWLRAYIDETDLGRVKLGQKAQVTTDTWPGRKYPGVVTFIAADAEFTPKNVQTQKERVKLVYRIKITISNPQLELKPGMPADAEIVVNDK